MAGGFTTLTITDTSGTAHALGFWSDNGNATGNLIAASWAAAGSTGLDFSANTPALPNVGAAFGGAGPYANYALVATVPAAPRAKIEVQNLSGIQIAVLRDDGSALAGAAPANASLFALAGGLASGSPGGSWSSTTFRGRIQIYALNSDAQVAVLVD